MTRPRTHLPGVAGLSPKDLKVAKKSFGYRWREDNRRHGTGTEVFGGDVYAHEARNWWLIAFAHGMIYGEVKRAKELLG